MCEVAERLSRYRQMRDLDASTEPAGEGGSAEQEDARFVVQEHHATRLHWDLRLERDGVLVSWAIPNGIPDDPKRNRKAVHVEDHPLDYIDFEGEIPAGNYGAGKVTVWDSGTYECEKWRKDEVIVRFHGERLRGRYALFQAGADKDWLIHRMDPPVDPDREPMPERLVPMLARLGALPTGEQWAYEIKWDGIRALAYSEPGRLRLESRNLNEITPRWPEVRALNRALSSHSAVLDGEIVAFDADGRPSFERLQQRMHLSSDSAIRRRAQDLPAVYVIFDLLHLDGHSLMGLPYSERRERLEALALDGPAWTTPASHSGDGEALLGASRERGLEGIVAKRLSAPYEPGRRSASWIKVKNHRRQEIVIGGWMLGQGRRRERIGALVAGYYDEARGDEQPPLRYAGKVGTGFGEAALVELAALLGPDERPTSPFSGRQPPKGAVFVEPRHVAEVEFTEWTAEGLLRHPSYKGLRADKPALEVVRERELEELGEPAVATPGPPPPAEPPPEPSAGLEALLERGRRVGTGAEVSLAGRALKLSNLDKVLYPKPGFTKGEVIDYYARVAATVVPHLNGRPLTLKRYPNGVEASHFYEKQCPKHRPDWVRTAAIWSGQRKGQIDYCLVEDAPTLVWLANLADLELHSSLSRHDAIERPTVLAFDLDPGPPAGILECARVALLLRGMFEGVGLASYAKTSGSKGMQVYVPLNSDATYEQTKPFSLAVAETLEDGYPKLVVSRMTKSLRSGKVLVDWSQNDEHKTTVCVYSLRAMDRPTVSTPLSWEELERAQANGDAAALSFDSAAVLERIERHGDLFAPVLSTVQELPRFG